MRYRSVLLVVADWIYVTLVARHPQERVFSMVAGAMLLP
jgi:hypothetical protein